MPLFVHDMLDDERFDTEVVSDHTDPVKAWVDLKDYLIRLTTIEYATSVIAWWFERRNEAVGQVLNGTTTDEWEWTGDGTL